MVVENGVKGSATPRHKRGEPPPAKFPRHKRGTSSWPGCPTPPLAGRSEGGQVRPGAGKKRSRPLRVFLLSVSYYFRYPLSYEPYEPAPALLTDTTQ